MTEIVCYAGGTCGDLICALIDPTGARFANTSVQLPEARQRLKKPHTFTSDHERDQYISESPYLSIPSHDAEYHIRQKHKFIGITVTDWNTALWAATRFKNLHRPEVWQEMTQRCGADTVEKYAENLINFSSLISNNTGRIIKLEDIKSGNVLPSLTVVANSCSVTANSSFYKNWLDLVSNRFIV